MIDPGLSCDEAMALFGWTIWLAAMTGGSLAVGFHPGSRVHSYPSPTPSSISEPTGSLQRASLPARELDPGVEVTHKIVEASPSDQESLGAGVLRVGGRRASQAIGQHLMPVLRPDRLESRPVLGLCSHRPLVSTRIGSLTEALLSDDPPATGHVVIDPPSASD